MPETPYSKIEVSGADAFDFLQGQLTNDLRRLDSEPQLLTAWCNPKGRVICLMRISRISIDGQAVFVLVLPVELAETVVKRLTMFRFRAQVEFNSGPVTAEEIGIEEPVDDWLLTRLQSGIADIRAAQSEEYTPHMLNLDRLDAISLDKGCYTGQEIVARTHYRGASKRRLHRFVSPTPLVAGDKVSAGERNIGDVVNAIGTDLLAVVPGDQAESDLTVNGEPLKHVPLTYS